MESIKLRISSLDTPWKWNIPEPDEPVALYVMKQTEKCATISEESDFQWTTFTVHLLLAYEMFEKMKDTRKALEHVTYCETHIENLVKSCREALFVGAKRALCHVTYATKAYISYFAQQPVEKVEEALKKAEAFKPASNGDKAAILGIKAGVCIQYGTPGHRLALKYAKEAVALDPDQAEWHFIVGNSLGRLRRNENRRDIGEEEIAAIEKAFLLQKDASYIVHLAQLYAERSSDLFFNSFTDKQNLYKSKTYASKAIERYKEALELRPNCPGLMARVAHGMLRIKDKKILDVAYVKRLLDQVVIMNPNNSMVYHDLGFYYDKFENNIEKALWSLNKANELNNIKAFHYMIRLKWKQGLRREIIADINSALKTYPQPGLQAELLTQLGAVTLLLEDDMDSALKYFNAAVDQSPEAFYMQNYLGFKGNPTNLLALVADNIKSSCNATSRNAIIFLEKIKPALSNMKGDQRFQKQSLEYWKKEQLQVSKGMKKF